MGEMGEASDDGATTQATHDSANWMTFWKTLPGVLTAVAGLLGTLVTVYVAIAGPGGGSDDEPAVTTETTSASPVRHEDGLKVHEVVLRADPFSGDVSCPVEIHFTGRINVVGGAGFISYQWERSDGANSPPERVEVDGTGAVNVETTWTRWGEPDEVLEGSHRLRILEPETKVSEPAGFRVTCAAPMEPGNA